MPTRTFLNAALAVLAAALPVLAGCSAQQLWRSGQQWQQQECARLEDLDERKRCERSAASSFDQYKAETEAAKAQKPPP